MLLAIVKMPRKLVKKLANPRGLLYVYGLLTVSWIISLYFIYQDVYLDTQRDAKQYLKNIYIQTDQRVQADIQASQYAWDFFFTPDTDYIEKQGLVGTKEHLLSVCNTRKCSLYRGPQDMKEVCKERLATSKQFHQHRVYACSFIVTLENDKPLQCIPVSWQEFKTSCDTNT